MFFSPEQLFLQNLRKRVDGDKRTAGWEQKDPQKMDKPSVNVDGPKEGVDETPILPPIRAETMKLLSRVPEVDWSWFGLILTLLNIG
jgi:hypothetical protein